MSAALLLIRPEDDGFVWHADGREQRGTAATLAAVVGQRRVVLAVPGECLTLTRAQAPRRNRTAWRQALPYALEDHLAEPVEALHFAVGATDADGGTPVAVIRDELLVRWLETLRARNLAPVAVIPDALLPPLEPDAWTLLADGGRVLVRQGPARGFACERSALALLLRRALAEAEARPATLRVHGDLPLPDDPALPPRRRADPADPWAVLNAGLTFPPPLDLLQGRYGRSAELGRWLRPWRTAAVLAGLVVVAQLAMTGFEQLRLQRERNALNSAMAQVYRQAVPDARRVINPRAQLAGRLQSLDRAGADSTFFDLLSRSGAVLKAFPQLTLQTLRFQDGRLELDLEGGSLETLDQLQQRLRRETRLEVQLRASKREGQVASRVTVREASS